MVGVSLRYRNQLLTDDPTLSVEELLPKLWERGVRSIEIRGLSAGADPVEALRTAELLWDLGFNMTVHSSAKTVESAVEDVFGPLAEVLAHLRQRELILTLHPIVGDNVQMLIALSDHIRENRLPVRIALENNRRMPDKSNGNSAELVLEAVTKADRGNVGICFDMGHWAWYTANLTDDPNMLPPKEFLARAIHTHIHAYTDSGADVYGNSKGATHFPLVEWREPLSLYMDALSPTFFGVYNLELTPGRFAHLWSAEEGYLLSADTLLRNYPPRSAHYDELREHYDERVGQALDFLRGTDGCYGTLLDCQQRLTGVSEKEEMVALTYTCAILLSTILLFGKAKKKVLPAMKQNKKSLFYLLGSSISIATATHMLVGLIDKIDLSILYTFDSSSVLILSVLCSWIFFKEKLSFMNMLGCVTMCASLICMSLFG